MPLPVASYGPEGRRGAWGVAAIGLAAWRFAPGASRPAYSPPAGPARHYLGPKRSTIRPTRPANDGSLGARASNGRTDRQTDGCMGCYAWWPAVPTGHGHAATQCFMQGVQQLQVNMQLAQTTACRRRRGRAGSRSPNAGGLRPRPPRPSSSTIHGPAPRPPAAAEAAGRRPGFTRHRCPPASNPPPSSAAPAPPATAGAAAARPPPPPRRRCPAGSSAASPARRPATAAAAAASP
jgi:hypothetical protein